VRNIEIAEYDPIWPRLYEEERSLLIQALGDVAVGIHHIGSTAVPGLAAKPTIDILIEVTNLVTLDVLNQNMEAIGYQPKGESGIPGRRYFKKGGVNRTHNIHAFTRGDSNVPRYIAFRDYLRFHPETATEYAILKKDVAANCDNDIVSYNDGKDKYVKIIEAAAMKEMMYNTSRP
jgi:GrpB-like predicted nucleotidyltransferase (UPF0157 family)